VRRVDSVRVDNTVEENSSVFSVIRYAGCRQQGHAGSNTLQPENPPVLNWRCWLTQVDPYNGRKTLGFVIVLFSRPFPVCLL